MSMEQHHSGPSNPSERPSKPTVGFGAIKTTRSFDTNEAAAPASRPPASAVDTSHIRMRSVDATTVERKSKNPTRLGVQEGVAMPPAEEPAIPAEILANPYAHMGHETLREVAAQKIDELKARLADMDPQQRVFLEGLENEFGLLFKTNYDEITHDINALNQKREALALLQNSLKEISEDLERLRGDDSLRVPAEEQNDIIELGKQYGVLVNVKPGESMSDDEKLSYLELMQANQRANLQRSVKTSILLVKIRKRAEEAKLYDDAINHVQRRQSEANEAISRLRAEEAVTLQRIESRRGSMRAVLIDLDHLSEQVDKNKRDSAPTITEAEDTLDQAA